MTTTSLNRPRGRVLRLSPTPRLPVQVRLWRRLGSSLPQFATAATAFAAVAALVFTGLSLRATQEGQYTDRYTKAVDQLGQQGPEKLQIRLGGIYALERLARDSPRDQPTIIEVLSSFVRTTNPVMKGSANACSLPPASPPALSADAQAALTVLGRRDPAHDNDIRVDLSKTCLSGADLLGANLTGAYLADAVMYRAKLLGANLTFADMGRATLIEVDLYDADLTGAHLFGADLTEANLSQANLTGTELIMANLTRATLYGTKLLGAPLTSADLTSANLERANLTGAKLYGTNLTGANLTGVIHTDAIIDAATITTNTTRGRWW